MALPSDLLSGCNQAQRQAILHNHAHGGPLLVLAGAGSGKTTVLTRRIQWLVRSGTPPKHILALTFTAAAAAEMRERVESGFPPDLRGQAQLRTFHSLALDLLRQKIEGRWNCRKLGLPPGFTVDPDAERDWGAILRKSGIAPGQITRGELFASASEAKVNPGPLSEARGIVLGSGKVGFDDLVHLALQLLVRHPEVAEEVRRRHRVLLVDEFQDIDPSQQDMLDQIRGGRPDLMAVGDDDQAIYGFRGADVTSILGFRTRYPDCTIVKLEWNYRSTPSIVATANRIFPNKPKHLRKALRPGAHQQSSLFLQNSPVFKIRTRNAIEELQWICNDIRTQQEEHGLTRNAFAILVRYNRQVDWYRAALQSYGYPSCTAKGGDEIVVQTLHASKGLQYPVVYFAGVSKGLCPGTSTGTYRQRKAQRDEEQRLFYVGVTRAESRLVLLSCARRHWKGHLKRLAPSPFLKCHRPPSSPLRASMSVFWFRTVVTLKVLAYMAWKMSYYLPQRMLGRKKDDEWVQRELLAYSRFCLRCVRLEMDFTGEENLREVDWNRSVFAVANHSSYTDIPTVFLACEKTLGFIAKRELGRIPFLSFWMKEIGCLLIDRQKPGIGVEVAKVLAEGGQAVHIAVFPEGTRSKNGALGNFKSGAFRMACAQGALLIPLAIDGTRQSWEDRRNGEWKRGSCHILKPISCSMQDDPKKVLQHVRTAIEAARQSQ